MGFTSVDLALAALLIEALCGFPDWLYRAIGHPVTWMGALLTALERGLNHADQSPGRRRLSGLLALITLLAATLAITVPVQSLVAHPIGFALAAVVAASLPAQRSLASHVMAVADALEQGGLDQGRQAVSMIVGRNPAYLDEAGVARAAIESLAENFADGVVAPAFWLAVGGLPGGALYKAINTADSMIGHKTDRYRAFGWAAARSDDWVNLPASRLAALWLILASACTGHDTWGALAALRRDAGRHRSPNAGWPEAAMAGALGLRLAGPRVYGGTEIDDAFMGEGRRAATPADIRAALSLYHVACTIEVAALAIVVLIGSAA